MLETGGDVAADVVEQFDTPARRRRSFVRCDFDVQSCKLGGLEQLVLLFRRRHHRDALIRSQASQEPDEQNRCCRSLVQLHE